MPYTAPSQYASQPQTVAYQHLTQNTPAVVDNGQPMTVSYLHLNKVASVPNSHQISQNLNNPAVASQLNKVANDSITMDLLNKLQGSNVTSGLGPSQVGSQFSNAPRIVDAAGTSIQAANIPMDTPSSKEVCFKVIMVKMLKVHMKAPNREHLSIGHLLKEYRKIHINSGQKYLQICHLLFRAFTLIKQLFF